MAPLLFVVLFDKAMDKMHSGSKSQRDSWRTELPRVGLGRDVLELLENEKNKDAVWQGKCSGTV